MSDDSAPPEVLVARLVWFLPVGGVAPQPHGFIGANRDVDVTSADRC